MDLDRAEVHYQLRRMVYQLGVSISEIEKQSGVPNGDVARIVSSGIFSERNFTSLKRLVEMVVSGQVVLGIKEDNYRRSKIIRTIRLMYVKINNLGGNRKKSELLLKMGTRELVTELLSMEFYARKLLLLKHRPRILMEDIFLYDHSRFRDWEHKIKTYKNKFEVKRRA